MNVRIAGLSAVAAAAVVIIAAGPTVASPRTERPGIETRVDEVSAAQQQQQHKRQVKRHKKYRAAPAYAYRPPVYVAPRFGGSADPSIAPNGRPYPRPNYMGDCVIDDGYGRWSACSNR